MSAGGSGGNGPARHGPGTACDPAVCPPPQPRRLAGDSGRAARRAVPGTGGRCLLPARGSVGGAGEANGARSGGGCSVRSAERARCAVLGTAGGDAGSERCRVLGAGDTTALGVRCWGHRAALGARCRVLGVVLGGRYRMLRAGCSGQDARSWVHEWCRVLRAGCSVLGSQVLLRAGCSVLDSRVVLPAGCSVQCRVC